MSRPKQFDDDQLLDSLRSTFLELGPGASTQELAHAAGVSEGTLFKRFGTKRKIFMAAMRLPLLEDRAWYVGMLDRAGQGPFEEHLVELAHGMQALANEVIPLMQMISANGKLAEGDVACLMGDSEIEPAPPFILISRIAALFAREMELGRIRLTDASALASLFVGALFHDFHLRMHFPTRAHESANALASRVARCVADLTSLPTTNTSLEPASRKSSARGDSHVTPVTKPRRMTR